MHVHRERQRKRDFVSLPLFTKGHKANYGTDRGWDGWMASPTRWTWVWVNSGSWWWTERPGMLWFMGSQRVRHNWATELNWTEPSWLCLNLISSQNTNTITNIWILEGHKHSPHISRQAGLSQLTFLDICLSSSLAHQMVKTLPPFPAPLDLLPFFLYSTSASKYCLHWKKKLDEWQLKPQPSYSDHSLVLV